MQPDLEMPLPLGPPPGVPTVPKEANQELFIKVPGLDTSAGRWLQIRLLRGSSREEVARQRLEGALLTSDALVGIRPRRRWKAGVYAFEIRAADGRFLRGMQFEIEVVE